MQRHGDHNNQLDRVKRHLKDAFDLELHPRELHADLQHERRRPGWVPEALLEYRAERRWWNRKFGDNLPYLGPEPTLSDADLTRMDLKERMSKISDYQNYEPMFGWNDDTGEPWLALRLRSNKAYLAVSGDKNERLLKLQTLTQNIFKFQYLRCSDYLIFWPEFRNKSRAPGDWGKMSHLRGFLAWWAGPPNSTNTLKNIEEAYQEYRRGGSNYSLPLPEGFPLDRSGSSRRSRVESPRSQSPDQSQKLGDYSLESRITRIPRNQDGSQIEHSPLSFQRYPTDRHESKTKIMKPESGSCATPSSQVPNPPLRQIHQILSDPPLNRVKREREEDFHNMTGDIQTQKCIKNEPDNTHAWETMEDKAKRRRYR